jgi:hypothetical protein
MNNLESPIRLNPDIAPTIPVSVAFDNRIVPVTKLCSVLIVATCPPVPDDLVCKLEFILNCRVRLILRSATVIDQAITQLYGEDQHEVIDFQPVVAWYWPDFHSFETDGTIVIKMSGWDAESHWTGAAEFKLSDPDYAFWKWVVALRQYHRLVDEAEVPSIKRIWRRYLSRCSRRDKD